MACGLVLVDDFFVRDAVDPGNGSLKHLGCGRLVATFNRLAYCLDCRTQSRALARVVRIEFNCLPSALTCLCGICHESKFLKSFAARNQCAAKFCKTVNYRGFFRNGQFPLSGFFHCELAVPHRFATPTPLPGKFLPGSQEICGIHGVNRYNAAP